MNKIKSTKIFSALGGILLMSSAANAHFSTPLQFRPTDEHYQKLELACGSSIIRNVDDAVYGSNAFGFFFRSGVVSSEIYDRKYYETFFITTKGPQKCVKLLATNVPMYGSNGQVSSIELTTPEGRVEVIQAGEILVLE